MNEMTESLLAYGGLVLFTVVFLEQAGLPWVRNTARLSVTVLAGVDSHQNDHLHAMPTEVSSRSA